MLIPAGEFTMGRTKLTPDDKTKMRPQILLDDRPEHKVSVDQFYLDTHEVTNAQYAEFVKAAHHRMPYHWAGGQIPRGEDKFPVFNIERSVFDKMPTVRVCSSNTGKA